MRGVIFGDYNTSEDWDLILTEKKLSPAVPRENYIDVPGRSGTWDVSDVLTGEIEFQDRVFTAKFLASEGSYDEREELIDNIIQDIHGLKMNIVDPDDPDHYLTGRVKILEPINTIPLSTFSVEATVSPWKYYKNEMSRMVTVQGEDKTITIQNRGRKTLIPTVRVTDGKIRLKYDNKTSDVLDVGDYKLVDLALKRGDTTITVSGNGTVNIIYREAVL